MEDDHNKLIEERREKLKALRAAGGAYPNDFRKKDSSSELVRRFGDKTKEELEKEKPPPRSPAACPEAGDGQGELRHAAGRRRQDPDLRLQ